MIKKVDIAILGAGTAGLSALAEVKKSKKSFVIIDPGPLGTTCARTGCMPSKVLIQVAHDFHRRQYFLRQGLHGGENLTVNGPEVMTYVRSLRDRFVKSVLKDFDRENLIAEHASFLAPQVLRAGPYEIHAEKIIIATGSSPILTPEWQNFSKPVLTSDSLFELEDLPSKISIIGSGVIGTEIGQALSRLGSHVTLYGTNKGVAGLTDPAVQDVAVEILSSEMNLNLGGRAQVRQSHDTFQVESSGQVENTEAVFASIGRRPNLAQIKIENSGAVLDKEGIPVFDRTTMQVSGLPIFIAGDVNADRPLLHEASDEGRIAGYNSVNDMAKYRRRTPLSISFTSPQIALVGATYAELVNRHPAIGEVRFEGQGRSIIKNENAGLLRIYADSQSGVLLGAEMIAPAGEHLAHLLALAIQRQLTVYELLQMPFYHPVIEEGLRTALRKLGKQIAMHPSASELALCESTALTEECDS